MEAADNQVNAKKGKLLLICCETVLQKLYKSIYVEIVAADGSEELPVGIEQSVVRLCVDAEALADEVGVRAA